MENKELDALKTIKIKCHPNSNLSQIVDEALDDFRIIKFKTINAGYNYGYKVWDKIEQALIKAQEQEKVLEILTSKKYIPLDKINPKFWGNEEDYDETVDYEFYLWLCEEECEYVVKEEQRLTPEEFELLKRYYKKKNKKEE